jgi:transposase InsO family protein
LSREAKRQIVCELSGEYPVQKLCEVVMLPKSSYYYSSNQADEADLKAQLQELAGRWPTYGARRLSEEMRRAGYRIGRMRTARLMVELEITARRKQRKKRTTRSDHDYPRYPNLVLGLKVTRIDQLWVVDITFIRLGRGFVYLAIVMDVYTRMIRGWQLSRTIDHLLTKAALEKALRHGTPEIHHSDQGVQYCTPKYTDLLAGVAISMSEVGQAWQNGFAERVIRTIKEDEVDLADYLDFDDALDQIGTFIDDVYAYKRIHSALGYLTPAEFEAHCKQTGCDEADGSPYDDEKPN